MIKQLIRKRLRIKKNTKKHKLKIETLRKDLSRRNTKVIILTTIYKRPHGTIQNRSTIHGEQQ